MSAPASPVLSASQLARLGLQGETRTAAAGDVLYRVGDHTYPFIAILEGEVAILDADGGEIVRHGAAGFLGEMNLLTGQTVFVTAVVTKPLRYVAVDRETLRSILFEDGPLSDLILAALIERREALQQVDGIGLEIVGPRASAATMRMLEFARGNHLPYTWQRRVAGRRRRPAARPAPGRRRASRPLDRCGPPGARDRARARAARGGRPGRGRRRAGRARRGGVRGVRGPRHAGRRGHGVGRPGGLVTADRELPRLPCRDHGRRAREPRGQHS